MNLNEILSYNLFEQAITGYNKIEEKKKEIITIIDYSKPSTEERLYVIDLKNKELLYKSLVAHGRNSGNLYATSFSNKNGSYKSSLGFFLTENTYNGKNGYSLVLNGLEKGINDMAKARAIVMHAAPYSSIATINSTGRLGRSLGCPAIPQTVSKAIINLLKGGSLIYIYANDPTYFVASTLIS
nr:murein L,D-transpeptidase catalytic domain family protein [Bacteroides sp. 519]